MNRAHDAKQRAYEEQNRTWQDSQSVRSANGPRIDSLNAQQGRAYQSMKSAYDSASLAHDRHDGAGAAGYAAEGRGYKEEAQGYVVERRRLVEEIRSARAPHDSAKVDFQRAKAEFDACKRTFDAAKAEHERTQVEFKHAKAEFDAAANAFKSRLKKVKAEGQKRRDDKKSIAEKAGVPYAYRDDVYTSKDPNGNINIYFGGVGEPNGPGHGHYVLDDRGRVIYERDPFDPHGPQNFTKDSDPGGTLYDRQARTSQEPSGVYTRDNATGDRGGTFYDRNRNVDLHVTQVYGDKQHVSWDTDGTSDRDRHWTDQTKHKGDPNRHTPPPDAQ